MVAVAETIFLYFKLPETRPPRTSDRTTTNGSTNGSTKPRTAPARVDSTGLPLLNLTHFLFLLIFSGMEFSLPFMTYDLFNYDSAHNGRLLGFIGLVAALLQGSIVRRLRPGVVVKLGLVACITAFTLLARVASQSALYAAATCLAVTSASVVMSLTALASLRVEETQRGAVMGAFRSAGQAGRALGPLLFCKFPGVRVGREEEWRR